LPDELTFLEIDFRDLAVYAAANGHSVECGYGSKPIEVHGKIAALRGSYDNGYYEPGAASTLAALSFASPGGSARSLRFYARARPAEIPDSYRDKNDQTDDPQPAMAL
jgi:hypothetical protein